MNPDITETKPGYKTTEFWLTALSNIGGILDLTNAWQFVPHKWAVIAIMVINGAYAHSRGLAKQAVPYNPNA